MRKKVKARFPWGTAELSRQAFSLKLGHFMPEPEAKPGSGLRWTRCITLRDRGGRAFGRILQPDEPMEIGVAEDAMGAAAGIIPPHREEIAPAYGGRLFCKDGKVLFWLRISPEELVFGLGADPLAPGLYCDDSFTGRAAISGLCGGVRMRSPVYSVWGKDGLPLAEGALAAAAMAAIGRGMTATDDLLDELIPLVPGHEAESIAEYDGRAAAALAAARTST